VRIAAGSSQAVLVQNVPVAGTERRTFTIESDAVLLGVIITSITGTMNVELYGLVGGQKSLLLSHVGLSAPTVSPLLDRSPISPGTLELVVTHTGAVSYQIDARSTGSGSSTIAGSVSVTNFPVVQDVEVQNWPSSLDDNVRLKILRAADREQVISYADFGTSNQRVTQIDYTAASVGAGPGFTARKILTYTLVGTRYRRDTIEWSIV